MIIVGGRNVFPEDIERAVAGVEGVRAGNVIAFGTAGPQGPRGVVVVAETTRRRRRAACATRSPTRVADAVGVAARGVVLVPPGHPAEDVVGQAPALAVPDPLPRRRAPARLRRYWCPREDTHGDASGMTTDVASAPPVDPALPRGAVVRESDATTSSSSSCFFLLAVAFRLPGFVGEVFNTDETFLATQAEVINDGGNLYKEAADRKPPLVPYIYAATFAIFGTTALWSVRLMAMVAIALDRARCSRPRPAGGGANGPGGRRPLDGARRRWRSRRKTDRPPTSRCSCCRR